MDLIHSRVELGGLGYLHSYTVSGSRGEITHEFPPLLDNDQDRALVIAEGIDLSDSLLVTRGGEMLNRDLMRFRSGAYQGTRCSAASFDLSSEGMAAQLQFAGGAAKTIYVAVLRKSKAALQEISKLTQGGILKSAIDKFKDPCWACKFIVKGFARFAISGLPAPDPEDIVALIGDMLPADLVEWLLSTDIGQLLRRIGAMLKRLIPLEHIAQLLCEEMGFCKQVGPAQSAPTRNVHICDVRLLGDKGTNEPFVEAVQGLPGVEKQSRFINEPDRTLSCVRVFSAQPIEESVLKGIATKYRLTVVEIIQRQ